jgi:chloramphenicol 3-O-phosphotransferase
MLGLQQAGAQSFQPGAAVIVVERLAATHLGDVLDRLEGVALHVVGAKVCGEAASDRRLAGP